MQELFKGYVLLFNALSETEEALARLRADLMAAQQQAEELYLSQEETAGGACADAEHPVQ